MTDHRLLVLYIAFVFAFFILAARVFLIANNIQYANHAQGQTITTLLLQKDRGNFYDCNGQPLTGLDECWQALCIPGEESYAKLYHYTNEESQSMLYQNRNSAIPFLVEVEQDLSEQDIYMVSAINRYISVPIATHLIGYVDQNGNGIAGLESAFQQELAGNGAQGYVQCITNAQGKLMDETAPIQYESSIVPMDIKLTLDQEIQRIAEGTASGMMEQGAIVILDTTNAKARASVSVPSYHPGAVVDSLDSEHGALLNRVFCAYSVGSVFKPVLAAAAIENNLSRFSIECKGYVDINGQIYRCANGTAHSTVDLRKALGQSCNCYFIELGQILGGTLVTEYAEKMGFGKPIYIANSLKSASGNMPDEKRLNDLGQLSNVSFGQGELLATPLQVAGMMNTIANDGIYQTPSFVEGLCTVDENNTITVQEPLCEIAPERVIEEGTAALLQSMLIDVVEEGIASAAQPQNGTAGGKTGTAQTGRFNKDGEEYKDLWFAGFYPAENPQYTIVVMQDNQIDATYSSAQIFAKICEEIALLSISKNTK